MTELLSSADLKEILAQFQEKRNKQIVLQSGHEENGSYGMAYLALWAVAEDFAKRLGPICQKTELRLALSNWLTYLSSGGSKQPPKITAGKFDLAKTMTEKIPQDSLMEQVFARGSAPRFYELISTEKKFRKKRNAIAHSGELITKRVYDDFKDQALAAFTEIEDWLIAQIPVGVNHE